AGVSDVLDVAVVGYELAPSGVPSPPAPGSGSADTRLRDLGVSEGDVLALGPAGSEVTVVGFVSDTSYLLQGALWVAPETWREVLSASRPDATVGPGVFQGLVVRASGDAAAVAAAIDAATGGETSSLTKDEAVLSLPGTREQNSIFTALIGATLFVAGLVSALFFALLTLERRPMYATLKAVGAPSSRLVVGVVVQSVVVAAGAVALGGLITFGLSLVIPVEIPVQFVASRLTVSAALVVVTAAVGGLLTLRRIVRIDPATAIS
ncbi:MAG TPA: FtsX-like permease family protein, partial [Acidimicrobiia bacterium]|nr:FtsX-like permease family protein [Acidimicrobiia bacterium]